MPELPAHRFPLGAPVLALDHSTPRYPFRLGADFAYCWPGRPDLGWRAADIVVPRGFATDLLSIPRALWPIFPPFGEGAPAAIPHDYLYAIGEGSRVRADVIFRDALRDIGVSRATRNIFYAAVRGGGSRAWTEFVPAERAADASAGAAALERFRRLGEGA